MKPPLFFNDYKTSSPSKAIKLHLEDMFPGVPLDAFTMHTDLSINGGSARNGDMVSFELDGSVQLGELILTVGINTHEISEMVSIVNVWKYIVGHASSSADDGSSAQFVKQDQCRKVPTRDLDTIFTYACNAAGTSCTLLLPYECRFR